MGSNIAQGAPTLEIGVAPAAFLPYPQFICYRASPTPDGKIKKLPTSPHTGAPFEAGADWQRDPSQWATYDVAAATAARCGGGVGFLFTPQDPFFFVDIDRCLDGGDWTPRAKELLGWFAGCAVEVSTSGTGLHIFGSGVWPEPRRKRAADASFELYTEGRFVALTGTHASGDANTPARADVISYLCAGVLAPTTGGAESLGWTTEPVPEYVHLDDAELLAKAMRSGGTAAAFGDRAAFGDLWNRCEGVLARAYPAELGGFDESKADGALAQHLAFWTGRNCERIEQLMRQSALVREKWAREDYMRRTIEGAVARQVDVYKGPDKRREQQKAEDVAIGADAGTEHRTPLMTLDDMLDSLVFVADSHAVANLRTKAARRKAAAVDEYSASRHIFVDPLTRQEKTTPAFKAWLGHAGRITVDVMTWNPSGGVICNPPEGHGVAFNMWRGLAPMAAPEDWRERVQPWVEHLAWLCGPTQFDGFMNWLAHIVQRPAELPHTCYLHVTPTTGIGRNWVSSVLARVLRGYVAAGVDLRQVLGGNFNGRLSQKLLAVVDEVREGGDGAMRHAQAEKFKSVINEEARDINHKYGVQCVEYNCCRWLMFSQHLDALPFDNNDRRVVVVSNPTERRSAEYYERLYALRNDALFIASVRKYLEARDLNGYNPSAPAPMTEAKRNALAAMAHDVDFAIAELLRTWPADVIAVQQVKDYAGPGASTQHVGHALRRAGVHILPQRVRLPSGVRSQVAVLRGDGGPVDTIGARCVAAEVQFKL